VIASISAFGPSRRKRFRKVGMWLGSIMADIQESVTSLALPGIMAGEDSLGPQTGRFGGKRGDGLTTQQCTVFLWASDLRGFMVCYSIALLLMGLGLVAVAVVYSLDNLQTQIPPVKLAARSFVPSWRVRLTGIAAPQPTHRYADLLCPLKNSPRPVTKYFACVFALQQYRF